MGRGGGQSVTGVPARNFLSRAYGAMVRWLTIPDWARMERHWVLSPYWWNVRVRNSVYSALRCLGFLELGEAGYWRDAKWRWDFWRTWPELYLRERVARSSAEDDCRKWKELALDMVVSARRMSDGTADEPLGWAKPDDRSRGVAPVGE